MIPLVRDVPGFQWILPESQTLRHSPEQMGAQLRDFFACLQWDHRAHSHQLIAVFLNPATLEEDLVSCQLPASLAYCSTDLRPATYAELTSSHDAVLCRHEYFSTRV
ncbi:hypothetical protein NCU16991 [Neurospora crassa OR74A]|uniref:Uncharacterized protein n=1 Tax=Neurospora crassa (strain ATCC 24698 / 74-OR23-1A / CBS 708.71 / DSM 1257 / FGSC 987) TaxID=367110 RepID=V5IP48_NEUCR|nr:hypothetical protein NCU16991 [Neurospora crassa OR74A]ESA42526.1 hypothetical protein NCU16991 [Neurospora crassa OR74A]|eukprot:XP_011394831.1 hypothetical protein NCU16991 [Neurospora crassa OR74A]